MIEHKHNILGKNGFYWFFGVVEDRSDPLKMGRVRVRAFGWNLDNKTEEPTDNLFWASCILPTTSAGMSGVGDTPRLVEGSWVFGFFVDGSEAQQPVIIGSHPGIAITNADPSTGFSDPRTSFEGYPQTVSSVTNNTDGSGSQIENADAVAFPRYTEEPDTPRLARNDPSFVPLTKTLKDSSRTAGNVSVPTAAHTPSGGSSGAVAAGTFTEPENPYSTVYPFNRVIESEAGHVIEIDDTPGAERVQIFHRSGSFIEMGPDGTCVVKSVNDEFNLVHRNKNVNVLGNMAETTHGERRMLVGQRAGNLTIQVANGDVNVTASGKVNVTAGSDANIKVGGNANLTVAGNVTETVTGNVQHTVNGSYTLNVSGPVTVTGSTIDLN